MPTTIIVTRVHRVAPGTMPVATLRRHSRAPIIPHRSEVSGPYSLLTPLTPTPPFTSRGGMPPRAPRCQFA
jgi:hypothetical protein